MGTVSTSYSALPIIDTSNSIYSELNFMSFCSFSLLRFLSYESFHFQLVTQSLKLFSCLTPPTSFVHFHARIIPLPEQFLSPALPFVPPAPVFRLSSLCCRISPALTAFIAARIVFFCTLLFFSNFFSWLGKLCLFLVFLYFCFNIINTLKAFRAIHFPLNIALSVSYTLLWNVFFYSIGNITF